MKTESGLKEDPVEPAEDTGGRRKRRSVRDLTGSLPSAVRRPFGLARRSGRGVWRVACHPGVVAMLTWAIATPLAAVLPVRLDLDPFRQAHADVPLVVGGVAAAVVVCLALWRRGVAVSGMAAGLVAAWAVLLLRTAWQGTPFPAGGLYGDAGRLAAMATRYTVTSASSDGIVAGVPSEYPPLLPWLIGKTAVALDMPAWRLVAPALILVVSASVIAGFLLWLRLTSPGAALVLGALVLLNFSKPDKAYETLALAIIVPLVLLIVSAPPRGRLHWLLAGLAGGLMALVYYGFLVYAALGVLFLVWRTWRGESERWAYVWYLARVVAVMLVVSSWYVIPYVRAMAQGGQQVADTFESSAISSSPLPFLEMSPLGIAQLAGLAGLLWLRKSVWWAPPLLAVVVSAYIYYLISFVRFVTTGHTGLLHYVFALISACLVSAAVLSAVHVGPALVRRTGTPLPNGSGVAVLAIAVAFVGYTYWSLNMPVTRWTPAQTGGGTPNFMGSKLQNSQAARAHNQPFPAGTRPRFSAFAVPEGERDLAWFPVEPVQRAVEGVLGKGARPRTLTCNEQLFAFLPWRGYIAVDRGSAFGPTRWDDRYAELTRLGQITDPVAFAAASARTRFGPIDVFVLRSDKADLVWRPGGVKTELRLRRQQFDPASFVVVDGLPERTVVAIRRR